MREQMVGVEKTVLRWARESAGLSPHAVASKLKRNVSDVLAWEAGEAAPSYAQLEKLAYKIYKRPLAVFFLPSPPAEPKARQEFRTLPDADLDSLSSDTLFLVRSAHAFQHSLRELNDGTNPAKQQILKEIDPAGSASPTELAKAVRAYFDVSIQGQAALGSDEAALGFWRTAVEAAGIFVFKNTFKQKEISGFSLYDPEFPLIYLNNSTTKTKQTFSLLHELAHLLFHANGISKFETEYFARLPPTQRRVEVACNRVASEVLMPSDDFNRAIRDLVTFDDAAIERLANRYWVSREVAARRLLDLAKISKQLYEEKAARWAKQAKKKSGGGNANRTQAAYLGDAYLGLVFKKHYQGRLSVDDVAEYLNVKPARVPSMESILLSRAVA